MHTIITESSCYDPIPDGINEEHYGKVREARKQIGLPVNVSVHPFRKHATPKPVLNYEFIVFGSRPLANTFEII